MILDVHYVGAAWRAGTRKREGAPGASGIARAAGIGPQPAGACGAVAMRQGRATEHEWLAGGTGRRRGPVGSG
jgi:hypothetical protein